MFKNEHIHAITHKRRTLVLRAMPAGADYVAISQRLRGCETGQRPGIAIKKGRQTRYDHTGPDSRAPAHTVPRVKISPVAARPERSVAVKLQRSEYGRIIDAAKPPSPLERLATVARSVVGDAAFDDARRQTGSNESHFAMAALASQLLLGEKPDESQWTGRAGKALQDRLVDKMVAELG